MPTMTEPVLGGSGLATGSLALPADYLELLKPRVMSLVIFTALCGLVVAPGHVNVVVALASLLATAVGAGASGALNMAYEADIDGIMKRTRGRPIPSGRVTASEAYAFGAVLSIFSVILIGLAANWLSAALLAFTILFYALVYTVWLKRATPQNIVIGGAAGALPPMIGYAIVTNSITIDSFLLFAIIFVWTPPHFWALALLKSEDYAKAGVPMMPNVKGTARTRLEILLYSLVLAPLGTAPWFTGLGGPGLRCRFGRCRCGHAASRDPMLATVRGSVSQADTAARQLFGFSILYLSLLFAVLLAEHGLPMAARFGW